MTNKRIVYRPPNPEIVQIVEDYRRDPAAILEIYSTLQSRRGGLDKESIRDVARALNIPETKAYEVASFYSMLSLTPQKQGVIRVCDGPVCWLCGGDELRQAVDQAYADDPDWRVERTSCLGLCDRAPAVLVGENQAGPVQPEQAPRLTHGWLGSAIDYSQPRPGEVRIMLALAGKIDPDSLTSALQHGVYAGFKHALGQSPGSIIDQVEASGLSGRGGAGFSVGRKWRFVAQAARSPKYVICNADESEPLIFKDRVLIDTNPHQILEGMAIAGYATGAQQAYIYIRGEYAHQSERLERAIHQAEQAGWLGDHIQGGDFSFHVHVHRGAGAYICGEETALIESLEGKRGEPRNRPPYPPTAGLQGLPTLVNNVESYSAVSAIIQKGAEWYRSLSQATTPGTKLYMLLGHVRQPGLFEAPFGITLRQAIDDFGGGMLPGSSFHFALTGGAAGTIVPASLLDEPIDYPSAAKGIALGAGAFLICDKRVSPVAFLRQLLHFFAQESCGKCTPCRVGTHQSLEILTRLTTGQGIAGDGATLGRLAEVMQVASFCGLGQSVAIPVKSALLHFADDFHQAEVPTT